MINRYSTKEMRGLWSDDTRFQKWLEVELAVCRAMELSNIVPDGTAEKIRKKTILNPARILEIENITRHDVIAFLSHIEEQCGDDSRWLHLGMTSSDVLDTSFAMLLRQGFEMVITDLKALCISCAQKAEEHASVAITGRSHGIHAEPTSLGNTFALWAAELDRDILRLQRALETISYGKIAGAVGNYANIDPEIETVALSMLGLKPETVATQVVQRDRHAEAFSALAITAATCEKIAITFRHWQRTEVSEVFEPFGKGQKGSSAMPHKRNPILSENVCGLARTVRGYASMALENVALWHERDISHSSNERIIAPDALSLTQFMVRRLDFIVSGCVVNHVRILENLQRTGGLIYSEAVLIELVKTGMLRQKAYEAIQRCAMNAGSGGKSFLDLLLEDETVSTALGEENIRRCFDLAHHIRHTKMIITRAIEPVFQKYGRKQND